jgi:hypothetical protein
MIYSSETPVLCLLSETGCPVHTRRPHPDCQTCAGEPLAPVVPVCGEEPPEGQLRWAFNRFQEGLEEEWRPLWARRAGRTGRMA